MFGILAVAGHEGSYLMETPKHVHVQTLMNIDPSASWALCTVTAAVWLCGACVC